MTLASWFTVGCSVGNLHDKSTGPITLEYVSDRFQFSRANGEVIVMHFDEGDAPTFYVGDSFSNIVYSDSREHYRRFIKAEGWVKGKVWNNPPAPNSGWICTGETTTTTTK